MKKLIAVLLSLTAAIVLNSFNTSPVDSKQQINAVLGDISFIKKFGHLPGRTTDENLRIKTHLEYVENLLRQKDVSNLSPGLQEKRRHLIDLLHNYRIAGIFPRNYDYHGERIPCFIDKDGRICAVGYLVEQTVGRHVAEYINSKYKYKKISEMNDKVVDGWVASSGLTKEECAMIQPAYNNITPTPVYYDYNHITPTYGISSSIICGVNLSLNAINGVQLVKGSDDIAVPVFGLLMGTSQVILGAINLPEEAEWDGYGTNESQKILSMVNIGLGTSTVILSIWNLGDKKQKEKLTSWNLYGLPMSDNSVGLGFSVARRF